MNTRRLFAVRAHWALLVTALLVTAFAPGLTLTLAQGTRTFDSGSTGADGALTFAVPAGTTVTFDPATFDPPLDPDGDNVYHFTTITIPAGVTVRLSGSVLGSTPVYWLASGAVRIDGTLDLAGEDGRSGGQAALRASPGAGGYHGGSGGASPSAGLGPGGGAAAPTGSPIGGPATHITTYGNGFLLPLIGGSGGGGSAVLGGGAGGGALLVATSDSITIGGNIFATGGGGTGGGSGGAIRLLAPEIGGTGTFRVRGGTNFDGASFGEGGRVRLEAFRHTFAGTVDIGSAPTAGEFRSVTLVPNTTIFTPAPIRIVRVGGSAVPGQPRATFTNPDVTLDSAQPVTVDIEASNVPPGTVVRLTVVNETDQLQVVDSTPLTGTLQASTATAQVTFPPGFTRIFLQAAPPQGQ
jgi:hypothetical protein